MYFPILNAIIRIYYLYKFEKKKAPYHIEVLPITLSTNQIILDLVDREND